LEGDIEFEDLVISGLDAGEVHAWNLPLEGMEAITITVAPGGAANLTLSVIDDSGQVLVDQQNTAGAGRTETIEDLSVGEAVSVRIQVAADPPEATSYALMAMAADSYNFTFMGTLESGIQRSDSLDADNDHFWFFNASDGDTIDMVVTPGSEEDPYVELYGPDGSRLQTIDNTGSGEAEQLNSYSILATGLYAIRVGEFDFLPMNYTIIVNQS
jgi:hypothetical protein